MPKSPQYTWYIDPLGNIEMNQTIAGMLRGIPGIIAENEECPDQVCEDRKSRSLWRCPDYEFASRMISYAQQVKLSLEIFCKQGRNGEIRLMESVSKGKRRKFER